MSRPGAHRRTPEAWEQLRERLYRAQWDVLELGFTLTEERQLRQQSDALMGPLVTRAEDAEARAAAAEEDLEIERGRLTKAMELISVLRKQLAGPQPPSDQQQTQEIRRTVVPLGSPTWHASQFT
ncbi:hypothetical protein [Streptacidiphilus rugosus]|uniref:hypothetical protein n=1 Tax=Streptacidiphilus rugosus TaxID=405783 RepID=UPI00056ADFB3|nr:hypothetical protein [Streptacidiphilus rugosus]